MATYRKKPVVIEAMQWYPSTPMYDLVRNFAGIPEDQEAPFQSEGNILLIHTLEGVMTARAGDWIIKGVGGEFYPCKPNIFEATYELAGKMSEAPGQKTQNYAVWPMYDGRNLPVGTIWIDEKALDESGLTLADCVLAPATIEKEIGGVKKKAVVNFGLVPDDRYEEWLKREVK